MIANEGYGMLILEEASYKPRTLLPKHSPLSLHGRHRPRIILEMLTELLATAYQQRINPETVAE